MNENFSEKRNQGNIFLIRHGKTEWSDKKYMGWVDVPLDCTGKDQSLMIVPKLQGEQIDAIYSSPLERAVETIRPLAKERGISIQISDDLKELHYGQAEGKLRSEHEMKVKKDHIYQPVPGGESLADVYQRAGRFIKSLEVDFVSVRNLVIVGHYRSNKMILGQILKQPLEFVVRQLKYRPDNGSVFKIGYFLDSKNEISVVSSGLM